MCMVEVKYKHKRFMVDEESAWFYSKRVQSALRKSERDNKKGRRREYKTTEGFLDGLFKE